MPGEVTLPIGAFDMTSSEGGGRACAVGNVLDEDGKFAAIASAGSATHELAGRAVNGCIGVEFGDDILLSSFIMKMRPTHGACGHSCTPGVETGCGTGWKVAIFVGPTLEELEFLQQLSLTTEDVFEYRVAVFKSNRARYAVICREPTPETGDDVEIDALAGFCQVQ
ncbi:hypothetical protein AKJ09_10561 [Labilithrix luteola]|uniref:Uncharacterized protein n=1 Tax=Labilithrix luteola TaxID=1391654 RepID=A0A0K1QDV0_9BACT|nr:hypothetical protein AKJ09_10561 [Labilithrix luteola]